MKVVLSFIMLILSFNLMGQCETWVGQTNEDEIKEWHTIYRSAIKSKDYKLAEEYWKKAYEAAPAADGKRSTHFTDGIEIYKHKLKNETDEAKKNEYKAEILKLYDAAIQCYEQKAISIKDCEDEFCYSRKIGFLEGRKGYDMYYLLNSPYSKNLETLEKAIELSGEDVEYVVFTPLTNIAVYQYQKNLIDEEETRRIYETMDNLLDQKIAEDGQYKAYFEDSKKILEATFKPIESEIFDCQYFITKLRPDYEADQDNPEVMKTTLSILKKNGCDESEPFYAELNEKWQKYAAEYNAAVQAEFEKNNPNVAAKRLYDEGKYEQAIAKYKEAIEQEEDPSKKAGYLFSMASIQFRKMSQYNVARSNARKAAQLREGWGRPYMLIGDMYAKSARGCGDEFDQRLAILAAIDKYAYAKSIDETVVEEANKKIGIYSRSKPTQEMVFMRGYTKGQSLKVGCWIGESVKVTF